MIFFHQLMRQHLIKIHPMKWALLDPRDVQHLDMRLFLQFADTEHEDILILRILTELLIEAVQYSQCSSTGCGALYRYIHTLRESPYPA